MRYAYPYVAQPDTAGFIIEFPDVPEALTDAETIEDIPRAARDCLVAALSFYTDAGRPIPVPSPGSRLVTLPVLVALKLALHDAMLATGISNVELAKRLNSDEKSIRRLRDPTQGTKVESLEAALRTLGRKAEVEVLEAAE